MLAGDLVNYSESDYTGADCDTDRGRRTRRRRGDATTDTETGQSSHNSISQSEQSNLL